MVLGDDINDKTMLNELNVLLFYYRIDQCTFHFFTGNILMMKDPEFRMASFFSSFIITIFFLVKPCSPVNDLLDPLWPFFDDDGHNLLIAKAVSRNQGIFNMLFKTILLQVVDDSNPTLCIFCIRFIGSSFCQDQYFF